MEQIISNTILVVDDDIAIRSMLEFILTEKNFNVITASSKEMALDALQRNFDIQVVLLDLGMPPAEHDMSEGLAVLNEVQERYFGIKVIVLTGQDEEKGSYESIASGAFDFLCKPIDEVTLLGAIERALMFARQEQGLSDETGTRKLLIDVPVGKGLKGARNNAEEKLVKQILKETLFNVHETARVLGIKRENVYYLMKKYGIERRD